MFRDSRLGPIGGGTSEILKEIIAKMVIDNKDYKPATYSEDGLVSR
jgi:alkylation response protein AidB-like acyl-CoA dehydrogenase